jgi:hypothetical protein
MAKDYRMGSKVKNFTSYQNNSGWEGVIVDKSGDDYKVKITNVEINGGMFTTQLNAGSCTGNEDIKFDSVGNTIWVSKYCFD